MAYRNPNFVGPQETDDPQSAIDVLTNYGLLPRSSNLQESVDAQDFRRNLRTQSAPVEALMRYLQPDLANGPDVDPELHARSQKIQSALDTAETAMRPEVAAPRHEQQAYEIEKATAPHRVAGETARDVARINAGGRVNAEQVKAAAAAAKPTKYSANEQASLNAAHTASILGPDLLSRMEANFPGIGENPDKYGSTLDALTSKLGKGFYSYGAAIPSMLGQGKSNDTDADLNQFTGYLEASLARAMSQGRINQQQYNDIKIHLPQVGYSPGENYKRLKNVLTSILPAQISGLQSAHESPLSLPGGADEWETVQ